MKFQFVAVFKLLKTKLRKDCLVMGIDRSIYFIFFLEIFCQLAYAGFGNGINMPS